MTQIIAPKTAAVSTPVKFSVFGDGATLRMTADPGASGAFTITHRGFPSATLLTLDTSTAADAELNLKAGDYQVTKTATTNSCGLYCSGGLQGVQCINPG